MAYDSQCTHRRQRRFRTAGLSSPRPGLEVRRSLLLIAAAILILFVSAPLLAQSPERSGPPSAGTLLQQGSQLFQQGAFGEAVMRWQEAAQAFAQAERPLEQSDALTGLAQAYLALGYSTKAAQSLELALTLVQPTRDRNRLATVMGALGQVYLEAGRMDAASQYLLDALRLAKEAGDAPRSAIILNNLGKLRAAQQQEAQALEAFAESRKLAEAAHRPAAASIATVNSAQTLLRLNRTEEAKTWFDQALPQLRSLPDSHDKAYGLINLALGYAGLRSRRADAGEQLLILAAAVLEDASVVAQGIGDARAASYAFGYRAHLYEQAQRYQEALLLTRLAVAAAQRVQAPESLYRWQWQTGRLLKALGQLDVAIAAYARAAETVQSIRPEMAVGSGGIAVPFRESGGRLFYELADLLLQRAAATSEPKEAQVYLTKARDAVELFKAAELRDYFQDECVDARQSRTTSLDEVSKQAAVIYPIILPDRTELLVSLPSGLQRFIVPVSNDRLTEEIRAFRHKLEKSTTREYLPHAQQLYTWLIRPVEPSLSQFSINTLVFVPDGALRTIPMAALHDGERFLISKYAVATTPSLTLTDPRPLRRETITAFSAGLTEAVQGFPPLTHVSEELQTIKRLYGGTLLLNREFLVSRMEKELKELPFSMVHIASHGQFESDVKKSFLLTFDDKLTMDRLEQFVGLYRFREAPLALLVLSACETAAGDDRAALGLAGVAIKAGATSALATLWLISDEASTKLVSEFYRQLQDPSLSKAVALQRAQLKMLNDPVYFHPAYWAAFLLLNNWL